MDSVTQATLGAAIGEAVLGRKIGNKAALYGAVVATLPDLDVFVAMGGPVADFTYHRSLTHSLIMLTAVTPLIATALFRWRKDPPELRTRWVLFVFLALLTHPLLDAFTVYGTQLLWPLTSYPFGWASIFIIDPLYTIPLLIGLLSALIMTRARPRGHRLNTCGLLLSSAYLAWTLAGQFHAERVARQSLAAAGIAYERVLTIPTPFNTVLWRTIAIGEGGEDYFVGYHSFLDGTGRARFKRYPARQQLTADLEGHWPADRLRWFTKGFFRARYQGDDLVITDLRMGVEGRYVFSFKVGKRGENGPLAAPDQKVQPIRSLRGIGRLWARIWDGSVDIAGPPVSADQ